MTNHAKLREWWWHRQGLDGSLRGASPSAILERSGWARSVGGAGPYLTLFSRGGVSREATDRAVEELEICELPAARGCTYVLPASDFALGLSVGQSFGTADLKAARELGVTEREIARLCDAVMKALSQEPLDPEEIRRATGKASRSLGEAGKKKGLTTTLPLALRRLQAMGDIRRVPINGRLDQQRYQYVTWRPAPLAKSRRVSGDAFTELARRFFRWIGPASLAEFRWFSGLGVKDSKAAVEPLQLVEFEDGGDRLMFAEDREAYAKFAPTKERRYALVSGIDAMVLLRRDHASLLEVRDLERTVMSEKTCATLGGLADLPSHAILDRGRIVGLWEYDTAASTIAWTAWVKDAALRAAVNETEAFVRDELGDARAFSLDTPASRRERIAALRKG